MTLLLWHLSYNRFIWADKLHWLYKFWWYIVTDCIFDRFRSASTLKSATTDVIILNYGPIKRYSQIGVLSKFSDLCPIYWLVLGHTSVTSLDVYLRKWEMVIDLRIGCRFENLKKDKCLWRRNRTWIWGLDVD